MEGAIGPCLFEAFDRGVHGLSSGGKGAAGQHFEPLSMVDLGSSIDDFLPCFEEFSSEVSELRHLAFDKRISQLLDSSVDDWLIRLSMFENALAKGVKRGLRTVAVMIPCVDRRYVFLFLFMFHHFPPHVACCPRA